MNAKVNNSNLGKIVMRFSNFETNGFVYKRSFPSSHSDHSKNTAHLTQCGPSSSSWSNRGWGDNALPKWWGR